MSPFQAVGDKARWSVIYDLLKATPVGDVLTYREMGRALELDPVADRHTIQVAMRRAAKEFLVSDNHAVDAVINKGYQVVQAEDHMRLARSQQRRSSRSLARGHKVITHVDVSALDPITRHAFDLVAGALTAQRDFSRRLDIRQRSLEKALTEIQKDQKQTTERTQEEFAEMRERLARLEEKN